MAPQGAGAVSLSCPGCGAPLTGTSACTSCGLPLVGPAAAQLWQVDQRIASLSAEQQRLTAERERLLSALRSGDPVAAEAPFVFTAGAPAPMRQAQPEAAPQSVQNTLLALGALLLAVAGIVFAAVTYQRVGPVGRALILLVLTAAAVAAPIRLAKRGLTASAEAIAGVALVLGALDAWVLRRAGIAEGTDGLSYSAVASGLLALAAGGYASVVPLRVSRIACVALAQLPVVFLLVRTEPALPVVATTLACLAALDLLVVGERRLPRDARVTAAIAAGALLVISLVVSAAAVDQDDRGAGLGFLTLALVLATASIRLEDATLRALTSGSAVPLVALAAWVTARSELTHDQRPLILAAVALLALTTAGLLTPRRRIGPVYGSLAVAAAAVVTQGEALALGVAGPFTWIADPWSRAVGCARAAVSVDDAWTGTIVTLVVLGVTAACLVMAGLLLDQGDSVVLPTGVVATAFAVLLPVGLMTPYAVGLGVLVAVVAGAIAGSWFATGALRLVLLGGAAAVTTYAAAWSTADRDATLIVLPVLAVLAGVAAIRASAAAGVAALLAGAALAGFGFNAGLEHQEVGGLLLIAPAACVGVSTVLRLSRRVAVELAAGVLAAVSIGFAADDATWLSICLGGSGVIALGLAIRRDRHEVGLLGGLLLSASSWVRLADAEVTAPEPYVAPLAITALLFGHLRRRGGAASSFQAYGAGLTVALLPTLLKSLGDDSATRGLLLLVVCVGIVLAGAAAKLRAPLVIGGGVLVVDALHLLTPFARALPRWSLPAVAGAVLLGVGLTYEQRRRDVARLKNHYDLLS
ncbi:MAG: hypothetical protein JWM40_461 [Frankiales bacterium]|nr:hypothetical protein [Frankiales bacterium]